MDLVKNKFFLISISIWIFVTIGRILNYLPWYDEAHAWIISLQSPIVEIFNNIRPEGHPILWYLVLMPFAKLHVSYPYSLQFLNWGFCFFALIILWKKAPFDDYVKVLITLSFPFLLCYPFLARSYSLGILLLFLMASFFKDKLRFPVLYPLTVVLCANTNVMVMFGAFVFGILFLTDSLKEKVDIKKFILSSVIFLIGVIFVFAVYWNSNSVVYTKKFTDSLLTYSPLNLLIELSVVFVLMFLPTLYFLRKSKQAIFMFVFTYTAICLLMIFVYIGYFWHHLFFYVYLIISLWLYSELSNEYKRSINIFLAIISLVYCFYIPLSSYAKISYDIIISDSNTVKFFVKDKNLENKNLIISDDYLATMLLPFNKNKIIYSHEKKLPLDKISNIVDNVGESYIFGVFEFKDLLTTKSNLFKFNKDGKTYIITKYKCFNAYSCIYKITKN